MTLKPRLFTKPLFHPPLIHFNFFNKPLRSCKADSNTGLGCMALFVLFLPLSLFFFSFASFFFMGRITNATCVRHHIGSMLLWALPWMRWPVSETKDSHPLPTTPPLLAFNTPVWLTLAWVTLPSFLLLFLLMHLLLFYSNLYKLADCPLKDAINSDQLPIAINLSSTQMKKCHNKATQETKHQYYFLFFIILSLVWVDGQI